MEINGIDKEKQLKLYFINNYSKYLWETGCFNDPNNIDIMVNYLTTKNQPLSDWLFRIAPKTNNFQASNARITACLYTTRILFACLEQRKDQADLIISYIDHTNYQLKLEVDKVLSHSLNSRQNHFKSR